jgi:tRNA(Ile)-lysidine synthase
VRPLLCANKEDILSYCAKNNIEFVTDSTNIDVSYARNFIRAEITPKMRELQPNLSSVFERLSESALEANDFIEGEANKFIENECISSIPLEKFNKLHNALKSRVLILAFEKYSGEYTLEYAHIKSIIELSQKGEAHSSISLPGTIAAKIENNSLVFIKDKEINENEDFLIPFTIGTTTMPNGTIINIEKNPLLEATDTDLFLDVKCDIIKDGAQFRSKKEGDIILAGKMNKKVKKLINEKKIPLSMRKRIPLLVCENEILWIPLVAVCDKVKRDKIKDGDDFYRITVNL